MEATLLLKNDFRNAFKHLTDRYKTVVIDRLEGKTLAATGEELGISTERVRAIENRAWELISQDIVPEEYLFDEDLRAYSKQFSKRTLTALRKNGITTILNLANAQRAKALDRFKGIGPKARKEVDKVLQDWRLVNHQ